MKKHSLLFLLFISFSCFVKAQTEVNFTRLPGGNISAQYDDSPDDESVLNLFDSSSETKMLTFHPSAWVKYQSPKPYILKSYTISSGNDYEERDLMNWELSGSNNGITFFKIDSRQNENFPKRGIKQLYLVEENKTSYLYYQLTMSNNEGPILQLSELELYGVEGLPFTGIVADFAICSYLNTKDSVLLNNGSLNVTSYSWTFEGGKPRSSTEIYPKVLYDKPGVYPIKLVAKNGKKRAIKTDTITIKDFDDWSSFIYPTIYLECTNTENPGYQKYLSLVKKKGFENISDYVQNCCLVISKKLYRTVDEANEHNVLKLKYILAEGGYLSYANPTIPNVIIGFDMNYLNSFAQDHSEEAAADEIYGILCHELTHCYQNWPKNAGEYGTQSECTGFVEGSADLARLLTGGFNPIRYPKVGGSFMDGYTTTGFFYLWLSKTKDVNFLQRLNLSVKNVDKWSLDLVTQNFFGVSAQSLWEEYQRTLPEKNLSIQN